MALDYAATSGCPDGPQFQAIVSKRLGYDPFNDSAPARLFVFVSPGEGTLEGHVVWHDSTGSWAGDQTFPSRTSNCPEIVAAMGFAVALQIELLATRNPDAAGKPAPPSPPAAPPPTAATPVETRPKQDTEPRPEAPRQPRRHAGPHAPSAIFVAGGGVSVGFAMAATAIPLARLSTGVTWTHFGFDVAGEASLPTTTRRADGAGFSQRYLLIATAACGREAQWSACAVVKAGQLRVTGRDIDVPATASTLVAQAGLRAVATQYVWSRMYVSADAEGLANVTHWTAALDGVPVWSAPRLAYTLGLDVGVAFR